MECQLQKDSKRAVQCEEEKLQLEEAISKLQQDIREMKNNLEKYSASIKVNKFLIKAVSGFSINVQEDDLASA